MTPTEKRKRKKSIIAGSLWDGTFSSSGQVKPGGKGVGPTRKITFTSLAYEQLLQQIFFIFFLNIGN